jgi:CheY-like chemotaxis protein
MAMLEPCRIVAIDDDYRLHQLLRHYLRAPEFELFTFEDPYTALMGLHDIGPDLVLCDVLMPGLDGWSLFRAVRTSPRFSHVPFILLSAHPPSEADLHGLTELDDFVRKPCSVRELTERVRARIGAAEALMPEAVGATNPPRVLTGVVAQGEIARALKHCEDSGLTGRLRLERGEEIRWLEFVGGELVRGGCSPEVPGADPLELMLAAEAGNYWIEPRPVDAEGLRRGEARPKQDRTSEHPAASLPVGRFAVVHGEGGAVQVQTEGVNGPNFTVTTVVARAGHGLRKVESAWPHPLNRESDWDLARAQIDDQHDRVVALVRDMGPEMGPRRTVWAFEGKGVEGQLLAWAISFVAEQVQGELGRLTTVAMLRGNLRRLARRDGTLAYFRVENSGRVVIDEPSSAARTTITGRRLPPGAVAGVARWCASFLAEAAELSPLARTLSVRHVTRMMRSELGGLGFYDALEGAASSQAEPEATHLRTSEAST